MKKYLIIILSLLYINNIQASELYISKKDFETKDYVTDCDFQLYDSENNIIDAWVATEDTHEISNIQKGQYKLVERPLINNNYSDELSTLHTLDINSDNVMEIILYNKEINTPRNLGHHNHTLLGITLTLTGLALIYIGHRKFYHP